MMREQPGLFDSLCEYCGEEYEVELLEIWSTNEFQIATCCEAVHEELLRMMEEDPDYRIELLRELGAEAYLDRPLRRVPACDGQYLLDYKLDVRPVTFSEAKEFVAAHHAHNAAPAGWKFGAGIWNGPQMIGVVMVGRPVARMIDASTTLEVNRLCVRRDIPRELAWNACSQLYGWAAREAKRRGYQNVITYTLATEAGTTLRAAGWAPVAKTKGGSWSRSRRPRSDNHPTIQKIRWQCA